MVYQTLIEANKTGLIGMWSYVNDIVPAFTPLFLLSIFLVVTLGSYFAQLRTRGYGDILSSFAVGSFVNMVISIIMALSPEKIIDTPIVIICIAVGIGSTVILFLQNNEGET